MPSSSASSPPEPLPSPVLSAPAAFTPEPDAIPPPVNLTRGSILNLLGEGIPMIASLIALRILIRRLGDERFGELMLAWSAFAYFSVVDLGLGRALTQSVARKIAARQSPGDIVCTGLLMVLILGTAGALLLAFLTPAAVRWFHVNHTLAPEVQVAFFVLSFSLPAFVLSSGLRGILEACNRFGLLAAIKCINGVLVFAAPLFVLLWTNHLGIVVAAAVAVRCLGALILAAACWRVLRPISGPAHISTSAAAELFRFGSWLTLDNTASPALVFADRWCLARTNSAQAVGFYGTPIDLVLRLVFVPMAIAAVLFPTLAAGLAGHRAGHDPAAALDRGARLIAAALFPITLLLVGLAPEAIRLWLGPDWAAHCSRVLQLGAIGLFVGGMSLAMMALVQAAGRPALPAIAHTLELPFHVAVVLLLSARWGITGAAAAFILRIAVDHLLMAASALYVMRSRPAHAAARAIIRNTLLGTAAGAACLTLLAAVPPLAWRAAALALILAAFALLAATRLLHHDELRWLWARLKRPAPVKVA
ncbi:MAG TPA: flippase [Phycisphaerae bacterium]|nr:flippase [Phycisphaerae bacterium]